MSFLRGRVSLADALKYEQSEIYWEEDYVTGALKTMLLEENAPGRELVQAARSLTDLQDWFAQHGKSFLDSR